VGHPEQSVTSGRAGPSAPKERKWLPTLSVLVVVAVISLGGLIVTGETEETLAQTDPGTDPGGGEPRKPVVVLGSVTITPLRGWEEAERFQEPEGVRLTKGVATLDAVGLPFQGTPEDLFDAYISNVLTGEASQLQTAEQLDLVHLDVGFTAVRGFYFGVFGERNAPIEGEVTTVLIPGGIGIVLDGWAETGSYQLLRHEVNQMIQRMQVG
jgi:hypothetical protein